MILITGGAGFIGSYLQAELFARGHETVVVDWLGSHGKWRNLAPHPPAVLIHPQALEAYLASKPTIDMVFHLGAISETTTTDGDLVWETNVALSTRLWHWCAAHDVRLVYASSAATYGMGASGFDDDVASLASLEPLNLYGWSKHVFDLHVQALLRSAGPRPRQWAGLKFFNVYGPNEYHKGKMIYVVKLKYDEIAVDHVPTLFRSDRDGVADGEQRRDFIWVGDVVDVMLWLLEHPDVNGLYNLGTGTSRSYLDLAYAVCDAAGAPRRVQFIDMPESLRGQYQSFTEARMERLRAAGYSTPFTTLEEGVRRYVQDFLMRGKPYR
jgi:ADP-L-glycero-D-manno-heptose 6-epimerase